MRREEALILAVGRWQHGRSSDEEKHDVVEAEAAAQEEERVSGGPIRLQNVHGVSLQGQTKGERLAQQSCDPDPQTCNRMNPCFNMKKIGRLKNARGGPSHRHLQGNLGFENFHGHSTQEVSPHPAPPPKTGESPLSRMTGAPP